MKARAWLIDFLAAPRANCLGCGSEIGADRDWLCGKCFAALVPLTGRSRVRSELCLDCGSAKEGNACPYCGKRSRFSLPSSAAYVYAFPIDQLIQKFKYNGMYKMEEWLGAQLVCAFLDAGIARPTMITYVPLHPVRQILRGYNQSERLAKVVAEKLRIPLKGTLKRLRNTPRQARQPIEKRRTNLAGAFRATGNLAGENVLLIDDVRTTGSTVSECAKALFAAGAQSVSVATIARTEETAKMKNAFQ